MPTYRLDLAYDGTAFRGYAANAGVRTVQGILEDALALVLRVPVETAVAGRTDAGVHARGQVVSFPLGESADPVSLQRSLNRLLAPEVVVTAAAEVPDGFDARKSAVWRSYRYLVDDGPVPDPVRRWTVWHVGVPLDEEAMRAAAAHLVGEHDFASLCRAVEGGTTVRVVHCADWSRGDEGLLEFAVRAGAFCHQLVRSMVALCVEVGRGRLPAAEIPRILGARDRHAARGVAPPHGLTLWEVGYPALPG